MFINSNLNKLFTNIICHRISHQLDECQPIEQAGFQRGYFTIDHIHTVKQLMEKSQDYITASVT